MLDLGRQGATIVERKNGWTVRFPDGKATMGVHSTYSDIRSPMNLRAEVLRNGFRWPFDGEGFKKGGRNKTYSTIADSINEETMHKIADNLVIETDRPVEKDEPPLYAKYITHPKGSGRPDDRSISIVRGGAKVIGTHGLIDATTLKDYLFRDQHQAISVDQVRRVLYWLGYRYDPDTVARATRGWTGLWQLVPEFDRSKDEVLPITVFEDSIAESIVADRPAVTLPEDLRTGGEPVENEAEPLTVSGDDATEWQALLDAAEAETAEWKAHAEEVQRQLLAEQRVHAEVAQQRERLTAEVERLQGLLARERSAPAAFDTEGWKVVATLPDAATLEGLGLEARVQVRWKEQG